MALKTITGKVTAPDGSAVAGAKITVALSQACIITGTQEVVPSVLNITAATDGTYSLTLQANNDLTPTGTFYTVTESGMTPGTWYTFTIVVPQTAGPFVITNIQSAPPTLGASPSHVSTLTVDGLATGQGLYGSSSNIQLGPSMVNLQSEGADMSGAVAADTIWAAAIAKLPNGSGQIYAPPGTVKFAAPADSAAQSTGFLTIKGAGKYATTFLGSAAVDHVLGLKMPGAVEDCTVDGGAATTNGLMLTTTGTIAISEMAARRVRCRNVLPTGAGGWNLAAWDQAQIFQIDRVYFDEVTVEGPSANNQDAFALSYINVCQVGKMQFRSLQRSPNFFVANDLQIDTLFSDGCPSTAAFVIDSGIKRAVAANLTLTAPSGSAAFPIVNTPYLEATNWLFNIATWGGGILTGASFAAGATWLFENCKFPSGISFAQAMRLLSVMNSDIGATSSAGVIYDKSAAASVTTSVRLIGATCDGTGFNFPLIKADNAVTWSKLEVGSSELLNMPALASILDTNITLTAPHVHHTKGYNPVGVVTPAVPASGVAVTAVPYDRDFYISTGAGATTIAIQGGPTITLQASVAGQFVSVPAGKTVTPTYANAPTWVVEGR